MREKDDNLPENISSSEYTEIRLNEWDKMVFDDQGRQDLLKAKEGYNFSKFDRVTAHITVWLILYELFYTFKIYDFSLNDIETIQSKKRLTDYDDTTISHCLSVLTFLGLLYREGKKGSYVYSFEGIILKKGMLWLCIGNKYMKKQPYGGLMDECLPQNLEDLIKGNKKGKQ